MTITTATLRIEMPLPYPWLTANQRLSRYVLADHTRIQRAAAKSCAREVRHADPALMQADHLWPTGRVRIDATIYPYPRQTPLDDDNLWAALKATRDGLADAGLVANDRQFRCGDVTWETKRSGSLTLTLTAEEG